MSTRDNSENNQTVCNGMSNWDGDDCDDDDDGDDDDGRDDDDDDDNCYDDVNEETCMAPVAEQNRAEADGTEFSLFSIPLSSSRLHLLSIRLLMLWEGEDGSLVVWEIQGLAPWSIVLMKSMARKNSILKNTAKLYGDALVWTTEFIDWLDLFELVY